MANLKTIQFLRNANLSTYSDIASAKEGLIAKAQQLQLLDGSPIAGRYTVTVSGSPEVRTVLGVVYVNGNTTGVTFFNNDKEFENVLDGLDYGPIGGTEASVLTQIQQADGKISGLTANVGTLKLTDYTKGSDSGSVVNTDSINAALSKLENQVDAEKAARAAAIDALDYTGYALGDSEVFATITEENGVIAATGKNLSGIKLDGYEEAAAVADVATTDTLGQALGKLQKTIHEMDKAASAADGQVVTTVSEADGVVSETKANVKDLQLGGYAKTNDTGDIASADTINVALSKLENKAAAITIDNEDGSINVATATSGTDISVVIKSGEVVLAKDGGSGLYTNIKIDAVTGDTLASLGTNVREAYQLTATNGTKLGEYIKIYKDSALTNIFIGHVDDKLTDEDATTHESPTTAVTNGTGDTALVYIMHLENDKYKLAAVNVQAFLEETEFGSGVTATNHVVHGVVDANSEKDESNVAFLTVGADGFKISGIKDAIDTKINKLNADLSGNTTHVTVGVAEADGKITAVTVAESDIASASALTQEITDRETADTELSNRLGNGVTTTNTASAQLAALSGNGQSTSAETSVEGAKRYADNIVDTVVESLDADVSGNSTHVTVGVVEADGVITNVTVSESNIANADDLTAEIAARKAVDGQSGQTYAANTPANYISDATSLNDADVKLDAALKTADDAMLTSVAAGNGISVSDKSGKSQTITAVAKSSDPVIEVTSNGIGVKENAVWDCGTF